MSDVSSISSAMNEITGSGRSRSVGELSADEFMKILLAELQNQNPLDPMDNTELMTQMTSIKNLEATNKNLEATDRLVYELDKLTSGMALSSAASLMGKLVSGTSDNGNEITGVVNGMEILNGEVKVILDGGYSLPMDNIEVVMDPDLIET